MKGSAVYNRRYPSSFRFGRINAKSKRLIAASFRPLSNGCVLIIPQGINFTTPVRNRTKIYHSQPLAFHLASAGETPPFAPLEPWFPLFCGTPGQGSEYIFAAKIHPFRPIAPLGREAVASLKVTLGKSAILPRFIALLYHFARAFIIRA